MLYTKFSPLSHSDSEKRFGRSNSSNRRHCTFDSPKDDFTAWSSSGVSSMDLAGNNEKVEKYALVTSLSLLPTLESISPMCKAFQLAAHKVAIKMRFYLICSTLVTTVTLFGWDA